MSGPAGRAEGPHWIAAPATARFLKPHGFPKVPCPSRRWRYDHGFERDSFAGALWRAGVLRLHPEGCPGTALGLLPRLVSNAAAARGRSGEHTSELQSLRHLVW